MSFYVTLPSTSSMDLYPKNTSSNFITQLATPISLEGKWQVGLTGFIYRLNISMKIGSINIYKKDNNSLWNFLEKIEFEAYEGESYSDLIKRLSSKLNSFNHNNNNDIFKLYVENFLILLKINYDDYLIIFDGRIPDILKLIPKNLDIEEYFGKYAYMSDNRGDLILSKSYDSKHLLSHNEFFFFYSDIIKEQYVGNTKSKLLDTIAIEGTRQKSVSIALSNPNYVDLGYNEISSINILITDSLGDNIHFDHFSRVIVKLHFRPKPNE